MKIKKDFSAADVAEILHMSIDSVYDLCAKGKLKNSSTDLKRFRFTKKDVEAYLIAYHARLPYCLNDEDE